MSKRENIFIILGICHGLTEEKFLDEIATSYKELFLAEKGIANSDDFLEAPKLKFFDDKTKIQTPEFKKKLKEKLIDPKFVTSITDNPRNLVNYKINFITIIDFQEQGSNPEVEKNLLETKAEFAIKEVLKEINITDIDDFDNTSLFNSSILIFFNKSIESNFKYFLDENGLVKPAYKKQIKMMKWLRRQNWKSTQEIRDFFKKEIVNQSENNLNDLFDYLDQILDDFVNKIKK